MLPSCEQQLCRFVCPIAAGPHNRSILTREYKDWGTRTRISISVENVKVTALESSNYPDTTKIVIPPLAVATCGLLDKIREVDGKSGAKGFTVTCPYAGKDVYLAITWKYNSAS